MRAFVLAGLMISTALLGCGQSTPRPAAQNSPSVPPPPPPPPGVNQTVPTPPAVNSSVTPAPPPPPSGKVVITPVTPNRPNVTPDMVQKALDSLGRMKRIGLALHSYHDRNQKFPPAYVADDAGKPLYSWRVLLLPFLEEQALYDKFDKTKAWDAPGNLELSNQAVEAFRSPVDATLAKNGASYFAIIDPRYAFQGPQPIRFADVPDGSTSTIAMLELVGIPGSWAAPIDPRGDSLQWKVGPGAGELHSPYPNVLMALHLDGSVRYFRNEVIPTVFPKPLTVNGGEEFDWE